MRVLARGHLTYISSLRQRTPYPVKLLDAFSEFLHCVTSNNSVSILKGCADNVRSRTEKDVCDHMGSSRPT